MKKYFALIGAVLVIVGCENKIPVKKGEPNVKPPTAELEASDLKGEPADFNGVYNTEQADSNLRILQGGASIKVEINISDVTKASWVLLIYNGALYLDGKVVGAIGSRGLFLMDSRVGELSVKFMAADKVSFSIRKLDDTYFSTTGVRRTR